MTNLEGRFRLEVLSAGTFVVTVVAPGYVTSATGRRNASITVVAEGATVEDVDVELVRGGVITDRFTDENGALASSP